MNPGLNDTGIICSALYLQVTWCSLLSRRLQTFPSFPICFRDSRGGSKARLIKHTELHCHGNLRWVTSSSVYPCAGEQKLGTGFTSLVRVFKILKSRRGYRSQVLLLGPRALRSPGRSVPFSSSPLAPCSLSARGRRG